MRSLPRLQRGGVFHLGGNAPASAARAVQVATPQPSAARTDAPSGDARGALATLGAEAHASRPQPAASALHADTPLVNTRAKVSPVEVPRAVDPAAAPGVTAADLPRLRARLLAGDRAGMYLELYKLTGQDIWLMHAQITSYTGVFGGAAITANYLAKTSNPDKYHVALDTFSRQIAASMIDVVERHVAAGGDGKVDVAQLRKEGDWGVWNGKDMGSQFPGNGLFVELWHHGVEGLPHVFSAGTAYGFEAIMKGAGNGKRPSEFRGNPRYRVVDSEDGRFATVTDKKSGKIEAFFDRQAKVVGTFGQIADEPLTPRDKRWHIRASLWEHLQANQDVEPPFDARLTGKRTLPSLPAFGADHDVIDRNIFRDPTDGHWHLGDDRAPVVEPEVIARADQLRLAAQVERRASGLPEEPPLPARYREAGLFAR